MAVQVPDMLIIKKYPFETEIYPKPLKVTTELHAQVRKISDETNLPIHKVASRPARARGLKHRYGGQYKPHGVAPRAGAWIET